MTADIQWTPNSCPTCYPCPCGDPPTRSECRRLMTCDCPVRIVRDEGHQEGCEISIEKARRVADQIRAEDSREGRSPLWPNGDQDHAELR